MRAVDIITKKRDGLRLSEDDLNWFIHGYSRGEIPDYQAAAWAMAVLFQGMDSGEVADLTMAMVRSGAVLDLSAVVPFAVDKHSTGGVGDKTTLVVGPMVAACGLPVAKMSGRGLGFTGGTLDKIESIPGYRCNLSQDEFLAQLKAIGIVLNGQTADLAPADGKLYALRDVTGTVPSIPLIASSIMSKKIAAGAQAIVLDVKVGNGAFMKTLDQARLLAQTMVDIGRQVGRQVVALLSDMNQPLGCAVGNALEVYEAIQTLQGAGPADFRHHCLEAAAEMLLLGKVAPTFLEAHNRLETVLGDGSALNCFRQMVQAQGGDVRFVDEPERLRSAAYVEFVSAPQTGCLSQVHAEEIGLAAMLLGAGRARKGDPVDHAVGVEVYHKVGDTVEVGQPLFVLHANQPELLAEVRERILAAHTFQSQPVEPLPLFYEKITE